MNKMKRKFNTSGPVDPERHYYVERTHLLEEGLNKVDEWSYFTIFAPRQTGKTTYFKQLVKIIEQKRTDYLPIWISFEDLSDQNEESFLKTFSKNKLEPELDLFNYNISIDIPESYNELAQQLTQIYKKTDKELVLIIDEFEGIENSNIINNFLHMIRAIYHKREDKGLRSVILIGVSNITGILQDNASPFNIADQINIPYFDKKEVFNLLVQHEEETGQKFEMKVKNKIYDDTQGQPGLVNALARELVEVEAKSQQIIRIEDYYRTHEKFIKESLNKNIMNVVNKAKKHPDFISKLLFGSDIDFDIADERIQNLYVNGIISNCEGKCFIPVPLYKKRIYNYYKPKLNGEKKYYLSLQDNAYDYIDEQGRLLLEKLMERYIKYIKERGARMFQGRNYYEGVYQYNLDEFLYSYLSEIGGKIYPETSVGGGKVDLLIVLNDREYIVEIKANISQTQLLKAQKQLAAYLNRKDLEEGFLVIYDDNLKDFDYFKEKIKDKVIYIWLIKTQFEKPSNQ